MLGISGAYGVDIAGITEVQSRRVTPLLAYLQRRQLALVNEVVAGLAYATVIILVQPTDVREGLVLPEAVRQGHQLGQHGL